MARPARREGAVVTPGAGADRAVAAGLAAATAVLVAATFSTTMAFGDSAESVAGVRALGVLHAPGYPAYVLVGRAFAALVPVGPLALRLNLLSALCATATVPLVYLAARRLGAGVIGAAGGAAALAVSLTFWFYGAYAKPYAPTGLVLAGLLLLAATWPARPAPGRAAAAGALVGLASGLSYQVVAAALPGLALMASAPRRWRSREVASLAVAGAVVAAALWGFVAVRARQDPAVNWGRATSAARLVRLVRMADFGFGSNRPSLRAATEPGPSGTAAAAPAGRRGGLAARAVRYPTIAAREFSALAVVVAAVGAAWSFARRRFPADRRRAAGLAVAFAGNVGAVLVLVLRGSGPGPGLSAVLRYGGFLLAANVVIAVWVALGLDAAGAWAGRLAAGRTGGRGGGGRRRRARRRDRRQGAAVLPGVAGAVSAVLAVAVVVPAAVAHAGPASHRGPPFAADYARNVFSSLPRRAVLVAWDAERTFPLLAAQVDGGRRPDVEVVLGELLLAPWYREELRSRLGVALPERPAGDWFDETVALARRLAGRRPVYVDLVMLGSIGRRVGYRQAGLVAEVEPDGGARRTDPVACDRLLRHIYRTAGIYAGAARRRWPNERMLAVYGPAHVLCGSALLEAGDRAGARRHARLALAVGSVDAIARRLLAEAGGGGG